ncbi:hypothetical protein TNCV_3303231 [Trichonephila clavipes]|nr:hypothetical protein TNCV_3303231 [Trichonephila clavipes]
MTTITFELHCIFRNVPNNFQSQLSNMVFLRHTYPPLNGPVHHNERHSSSHFAPSVLENHELETYFHASLNNPSLILFPPLPERSGSHSSRGIFPQNAAGMIGSAVGERHFPLLNVTERKGDLDAAGHRTRPTGKSGPE